MKIFVGWAFLPTNEIQDKLVVGKNAHPTGVNNG